MAKQETKNNSFPSLADLAQKAFENKDQVKPSFNPGITTEFDLTETSQALGAANRPELGTQAMTELSQQFAKEKAYNDAKNKADEQGFFGETLGALNQLVVGEIIGGTIEGIGYLADWDQIENLEKGTQSFGTLLTDAGKGLREWTQEATPIYMDPDTPDFAPWSYEWWASNAPSIGSAISIFIPVAGQARALALAGKGLNLVREAAVIGKLGKSAKTIGKVLDSTIDAAKAITPELGYATKMSAKGLQRATVSVHIESMMEATGTFKEEFDKLVNSGIPEDQARHLAAKSASFVYKANWANLATEFMQQMLLIKGAGSLTKGVQSTEEALAAGLSKAEGRMGAVSRYAKQIAAEGSEEAYQFIIQQEGMNIADVEAGLTKEEDFSDRMGKYLTDGELWTSAFFGGLGGVAFEKFGGKIMEGVQKKFLGAAEGSISYEQARLDDLKTQTTRSLAKVKNLKEARESGVESAIMQAENDLAASLGINSAKNETLDYMLDRFDNLKNLSEEEREQYGIDDNFVQNIDRHKKNIAEAATLYADNTRRFGPQLSEVITQREFTLNRLNENLPKVRKNYDDVVTSIPRYTETTKAGRELIDTKTEVLANSEVIKFYENRLKDPELTSKNKEDLQKDLTAFKQHFEESKLKVEELIKTFSEELNDADKLALRSLDGKIGEDLVKAKTSLDLHNNTISNLTEEVTFLTSKEGREYVRQQAEARRNEKVAETKDVETRENVEQENDYEAGTDESREVSFEEIDNRINSGELDENTLDPTTKEELNSWRQQKNAPADEYNEALETEINFPETSNDRTPEKKQETKTVIHNTVNFDNLETPENKEEFFGSQYEDITKLSNPSALSWKSAYQKGSTSEDRSPKNIALTNYLENPDTNLSEVELRFEIDFAFLEDQIKKLNFESSKPFKLIKDALDKKQMISDELVGLIPVKAKFFKDNKQIEYNGQLLEAYIHKSNYEGFSANVAQQAETEIRRQKHLIVEAYLTNKQYSSELINKSNGYLLTKRSNISDFAKNSLVGEKESIFTNVADVNFSIGINDRFVNPNTKEDDFSIIGDKADNGAIYAKIRTANGNQFPLRLQVQTLTVDEANLVFDLFSDILANPDVYKQNISKEIQDKIKSSSERIINEIPTYLNLDNTSYQELLDNLVYNGYSKTKNAGSSRLFTIPADKSGNPAKLRFGKTKEVTLAELAENKEAFIQYLTTGRRRQVTAKLLNNEAYKKYIITNTIVTTNAYTNEAGRPFVQPRLDYNPTFKLVEQPKSNKEIQRADIEKRRQEALNKIEYIAADMDYYSSPVSKTKFNTEIGARDSVNFVYDAELAALESQKTTKVEPQLMNAFVNLNPKPSNNIKEETDFVNDIPMEEYGDIDALATSIEYPLEELGSERPLSTEEINKPTEKSQEDEIDKLKKEAEELIKKEGIEDDVFRITDPNIKSTLLPESEINHIRSILPKDIAIKVESDYLKVLDNGQVAIGLFRDNMIKLSEKASIGTGYHEAFHAVYRSILDSKDQKKLYKEATDRYIKYTTEDIENIKRIHNTDNLEAIKIFYEEQMADEFMDYMTSDLSKPKTYSKGIKGLFKRLSDWIKNVFSNRSKIDSLFRNINTGKYKNSPVKLSRSVAYKAIIKVSDETGDTFTADEIKEITQQLTYIAITSVEGQKFSNLKEAKSAKIDNIRNYLLKHSVRMKNAGNEEMELRTLKILKPGNFTYFIGRVEDYLASMKISEEVEKIVEDESGNLMYQPSYETSGKDSAGKEVKLLVALVPKLKSFDSKNPNNREYDLKSYLGLPKFENFSETWNKLENNLHSIVPIYKDGKTTDTFETMMDKLLSMSRYHPSLGFIRNKLLNSPTLVKNQFHVTFSRMKGIYTDALISGTPDGNMNYRLSSSDTFSKTKEIAGNWADTFKKNFQLWNPDTKTLSYNQDKLDELANLHGSLYTSLFEDRKNRNLSGKTMDLLNKELTMLGIKLSSQALDKAIDSQDFSKDTPENLIRLNKVNNFIAQLDKSISSYKGYKGLLNSYKNNMIEYPRKQGSLNDRTNQILDQKFFYEELAGYQSDFIKAPGENTIVSAGGNITWIFQDNNLMSKLVSSVKAGDISLLESIKDSPWNTNSLWIDKLIKSEEFRKKFEINLYNNYKNTDDADSGDKAKDLKEADKLNDTVNKYLAGTFIGLAEADKSQQYYIKGFELENSQVTYKDGNVVTTGNNATNILTNYFIAEVTRMVTVFNQLNNPDFKSEDQIMYLHYGKNPGDGNGNWSKSYLFPNMDLYDAGILHKSAKEGSKEIIAVSTYDSLSAENKKKIEGYISSSFTNMVTADLIKLAEYNIIKKTDTGYDNLTIDKSKIVDKYNNDTVFAVGDYTLNSMIANIEFTKLFTQDPALYKRKGDGFEDFRKRIPATIASGKDLRIFKDSQYEVREAYTSAVIENIITPSEYFSNNDNLEVISEATGLSVDKLKILFEGYEGTNETDAQAWITIDLYKERMVGWGKWTDGHEEAFNRIKANKSVPSDLVLFAQPLKTVHAEIKMISGFATMQYNKQSEAVLLPHIVKELGLENLLESMITNGVDHIITLDGKKVGATNVTKVRDDNRNILPATEIKLKPISLSNRNLFLQQDLPTKGIKDTLVGSQSVKNVLSMLKMTETYEGLTGLELYNEYHKVISQLSNLGLVEIKNKLGYNNEKAKITDFSNLNKEISKELKDSASSNIINAIQAGSPFDSIVQFKTKIQNKFASMITKKTVKLKQLGGSMIQTSSFGFTAKSVKLSDKIGNGIIWFKNPGEQLQPARLRKSKEGKIKFKAAQVLIPHSKIIQVLEEKGVIKDYTEMTHEQIKALISPEVLKGLSYRIPNQGPASNDAFEIVGILPEELGDTVVAYKEITVKTGSDFDIDKAYIILPNFDYNPKTKRLETTADNSKEGLQNRRLKLMISMLSNTNSYAQLMRPLDAPWLKDLIYGTKGKEGLIKQDTTIDDLYFFTGTNQVITKSLFDGAKTLVGVIAKHMTHHNLTKHEDITYNNYYIGKGISGNIEAKDDEGNILILDKESKLSIETDEAGNSVEETLIAYANAIVDAAKDPFILKANINQFTANTAFMLARAGVDREWISAFMLQPILVDLVKEMQVSEGRIASKERGDGGELISSLDKILAKYDAPISGREFKKSPMTLEKDETGTIKINTSTLTSTVQNKRQSSNEEQLRILGQFIEWQNKAFELSDLMTATASDTDGATKDGVTAKMRDNLLNKVIDSGNFTGLNKFIGFTENENGEKIFNNTRMIGSFHNNSVKFMMDISKQLFVSSSDSYLHSLFNIAKYAGHNFLQDKDIAKTIDNELFAALTSKSNIISFENKKDLLHLLYPIRGNPSLGDRVLEAKNKYPDNDLIQSLAVSRGSIEIGEPTLIGLSPKSLDIDAKNNLYLHWEDLLIQDKQLGEDLIKYAFYSSGLSTNFRVFFEHIPHSWLQANGMNDFIKLQLTELNQTSKGLSNIEDQVFRHLYKNNKIVPTVSPRVIRKEVLTTQGTPIQREHFIVIDEFNAGNLKLDGKNIDGENEYKRFIKTKSTVETPANEFGETSTITNINLYQLKGYKMLPSDKDPNKMLKVLVYERTNPLGFNRGVDIIKEYGGSNSIFPSNQIVIPEEVYNHFNSDKTLVEPKELVNLEDLESDINNKTEEEQSSDYIFCKRPE